MNENLLTIVKFLKLVSKSWRQSLFQLIYIVLTNYETYLKYIFKQIFRFKNLTTAGPRYVGAPRQDNNMVPLQTDILNKVVQHLFTGSGEKLILY
jgi:hypothetical protein